MVPKMPVTEGDFSRQPLREQINLKHLLVGLADPINWERLASYHPRSDQRRRRA
jgi:transposase, IS5 family